MFSLLMLKMDQSEKKIYNLLKKNKKNPAVPEKDLAVKMLEAQVLKKKQQRKKLKKKKTFLKPKGQLRNELILINNY